MATAIWRWRCCAVGADNELYLKAEAAFAVEFWTWRSASSILMTMDTLYVSIVCIGALVSVPRVRFLRPMAFCFDISKKFILALSKSLKNSKKFKKKFKKKIEKVHLIGV